MSGGEGPEGEDVASADDREEIAAAADQEGDGRSEEGDGEDEEGPSGEAIEIAVPPNLLRAWEHRAESARLSLSEYVVRMAEAGRMSVQMDPATVADDGGAGMTEEQLADDIVSQLRRESVVSWDDLLGTIARGLEEDVEAALERLQEDDVVRYSGLEGGYRLVDDGGDDR